MTLAKAVYWLSTCTPCLVFVADAVIYLTQRPMFEEGFAHFVYPTCLITVLIMAQNAARRVASPNVLRQAPALPSRNASP